MDYSLLPVLGILDFYEEPLVLAFKKIYVRVLVLGFHLNPILIPSSRNKTWFSFCEKIV